MTHHAEGPSQGRPRASAPRPEGDQPARTPNPGDTICVVDRFGEIHDLIFAEGVWRGALMASAAASDAPGDSGEGQPMVPLSYTFTPAAVAEMEVYEAPRAAPEPTANGRTPAPAGARPAREAISPDDVPF